MVAEQAHPQHGSVRVTTTWQWSYVAEQPQCGIGATMRESPEHGDITVVGKRCGTFNDVRFYPILNFAFFFGPNRTISIVRCTFFWPKRMPTILNFYPTRYVGCFGAALSKMSLIFSKFVGRFRRHTQCPLFFVSSSVSSFCLLLWLCPFFVSRRTLLAARCVRFGMVVSPMVTGFFETEQSRKQRKQNTEENQDEQK